MDEERWLACDDPYAMLQFVGSCVSDRKLRLFAVACVRRASELFRMRESTEALDLAERWADGSASDAEVSLASEAMQEAYHFSDSTPADWAACLLLREGRAAASRVLPFAVLSVMENEFGVIAPSPADLKKQAEILRELVANPFRSPLLAPFPLKHDHIVELAQDVYDHRLPDGPLEPAHLVALADALEGAGCDNQEVLAHLREPGPHVRGCWALDLTLSKS